MSIPSRQKQGSWEVEAGGSDHRVPGQPGLHLKEKGRGRKRWGQKEEEEYGKEGEEEEKEEGEIGRREGRKGGRGGRGAGRGKRKRSRKRGKRRIRKRRESSKRKGSRKRRGGKRRRRTSIGQHWLWCGQGLARENRVGKQGQAPKGV